MFNTCDDGWGCVGCFGIAVLVAAFIGVMTVASKITAVASDVKHSLAAAVALDPKHPTVRVVVPDVKHSTITALTADVKPIAIGSPKDRNDQHAPVAAQTVTGVENPIFAVVVVLTTLVALVIAVSKLVQALEIDRVRSRQEAGITHVEPTRHVVNSGPVVTHYDKYYVYVDNRSVTAQPTGWKCFNCGTIVSATANFCRHCGAGARLGARRTLHH